MAPRSSAFTSSPVRTSNTPGAAFAAAVGTCLLLKILLALGIATLLWADLTNGYVWAVLTVTLGFGAIGFVDDYIKLTKRSSNGLSLSLIHI